MAFCKAKLHRFNDDTSCAPPPGTYDPKLPTKVRGAVMDKEERFKHPVPTTPLGHASSVESIDSMSTYSAPIFRTPHSTLIKKRPAATPRTVKGGDTFSLTPSGSNNSVTGFQAQSEPRFKKKLQYTLRSDSEQKLIDQIDELARVHTLQLLEKNQEIISLQEEVDKQREMIKTLEERDSQGEKGEGSLEVLKGELDRHKEMLANEKEAAEILKSKAASLEEKLEESLAIVGTLEQELEESRKWLGKVENKCCRLEKEMEELICQHKTEVKKMSGEHESNMSSLSNEVDVLLGELQIGFQQRLEFVVEEAAERMTALGSLVTESQADIIRLQQEVDRRCCDLERALTLCRSWNENTLKDFTEVVDECEIYKATSLEHRIRMVEVEEELNKVQMRCHNYGIVHAEAISTVEVLSKRLYKSETDVERLNSVQEDMRTKCARLEQRVRTLLDEDRIMRENLEEMKETMVKDVQKVERQLLAKVDAYRQLALEETERLKASLQERSLELEECRLSAEEKVSTERALYQALKAEFDLERISKTSIEDSLEKLKSELEMKDGELLGLASRLHATEAEKDLLKDVKDRLENAYEVTSQEKQKLEEIITGLEDDFEILKSDLEEKCNTALTLSLWLKDLEAEKDSLMSENCSLENRLANVIQEKEDLNSRLNNVLENNELEQDSMKKYIDHLNGEMGWLRSNLDNKDCELLRLEDKVTQLEEDKSKLENCLGELSKEKDSFHAKLKITQTKVDQTRAELESIREQYSQQEVMLHQENEFLLSESSIAKEKMVEAAEEIRVLEERLDILEAESKAKDATQERNLLEKNDLLIRIEDLKSEVTDLEKTVHKMSLQAKEKELEMKVVVQSAVEAQDDVAAIRERLEKEERELVLERSKSQELEAWLAASRGTIEELRRDMASLKEINKTLLEDLDTMKSCTGECAHSQSLQSKLDQCTTERGTLERELAALREDHARVLGHQNNRQKIHHIGNMMKTIFQLRQEVGKLQAQNLKLKQKTASSVLVTSIKEDHHGDKKTANKENPPVSVPNTVGATLQEPVKRSDRNTAPSATILRQRN